MFESIKVPFALMMLFQNLEVANTIILVSMGRTSIVLYFGLVGSWVLQVPAVLIAVSIKKDISSVFYGVSFVYFIQCMFHFVYLYWSDWDFISKQAVKRVQSKTQENQFVS